MKTKIILIFLIIALSFTSCSKKVEVSTNNNVTATVYTANYIINTSCILSDTQDFVLPIKGIKVLDNEDGVKLELVKYKDNPSVFGDIESEKTIFKYKDIEKYSAIKCTFDLKAGSKYRTYASEVSAKLEVELDGDELTENAINKFRKEGKLEINVAPNANKVVFFDGYTGSTKMFAIKSTADIDSDYNSIADFLTSQSIKAADEFTKDDIFLKVASEISKTFKSPKVYDKVTAICSWLSKNVQYELTDDHSYYDLINSKEIGKNESALQALKDKKTTCIGYSYLFNALAYYNGINTQVVTGAAYGEDGDIKGHSWNTVVNSDNLKILLVDPTSSTIEYYPNEQFSKDRLLWDDKKGDYVNFIPNFLRVTN